MNTNENTNETVRNDTTEDVIELGVASVETKGGVFEPGEAMGLNTGIGISEE